MKPILETWMTRMVVPSLNLKLNCNCFVKVDSHPENGCSWDDMSVGMVLLKMVSHYKVVELE